MGSLRTLECGVRRSGHSEGKSEMEKQISVLVCTRVPGNTGAATHTRARLKYLGRLQTVGKTVPKRRAGCAGKCRLVCSTGRSRRMEAGVGEGWSPEGRRGPAEHSVSQIFKMKARTLDSQILLRWMMMLNKDPMRLRLSLYFSRQNWRSEAIEE